MQGKVNKCCKGLYHDGPIVAYLSKAPGDVREYDGSGDWFKIYELGLEVAPNGEGNAPPFAWLALERPWVRILQPSISNSSQTSTEVILYRTSLLIYGSSTLQSRVPLHRGSTSYVLSRSILGTGQTKPSFS